MVSNCFLVTHMGRPARSKVYVNWLFSLEDQRPWKNKAKIRRVERRGGMMSRLRLVWPLGLFSRFLRFQCDIPYKDISKTLLLPISSFVERNSLDLLPQSRHLDSLSRLGVAIHQQVWLPSQPIIRTHPNVLSSRTNDTSNLASYLSSLLSPPPPPLV